MQTEPECQNDKRGFYQIRKEATVDQVTYYLEHGEPFFPDLEKITEEEYFNLVGKGKTMHYGFTRDEVKAIDERLYKEGHRVRYKIDGVSVDKI